MPRIRNRVYTHPDQRRCQGKEERRAERGRITYTVQSDRDASERVCERDELVAQGYLRRCEGVFGRNAVFGVAGEETKGSEAGSRTVEVTWPAKPSGLSNFRLDTSSSSHFAYQPHVTFVPLCPILHLLPSLYFTTLPHFFLPDRD